MSTNRCFETLDTTVVNGSDRINSRRQETIYLEMQRNSAKKGPNPPKKNGSRYNQNFISKKNTSGEYSLASAKNYDLLLDITKGKRFANPVKNVGHNRYKMWGGNVMQVNYKDKIPSKSVTWVKLTHYSTSNTIYKAIALNNANALNDTNVMSDAITISYETVDPNHNIFYSPCYFTTPGHIPPWIQNVASSTPIFENTYYYLQGANADPLRGMSYPEEITFKHQEPCKQEDTAHLKNRNCH